MTTKLTHEEIKFQMNLVNDIIASWKTQIIYVLHKIGVFEILKEGPIDIETISKKLKIPKESLKRLIKGGVALDYIEKNENLYSNSAQVDAILIPKKSGYMGNWLELSSRWYYSFGSLETAVRENRYVEDINFDNDDSYKKLFIKGMIDYAKYRGSDILNHIDLSDKKLMLDVGCGPGVYAAIFCAQNANLKVHGIDLRHAINIAVDYLAEYPDVSSRIDLIECDYREVESFKYGYDVIFLSHILHQESEKNCINLLKKCYDALIPGGLLIIQAMFEGSKGMSSTYAILHDLLSLIIFPGGKNHSIEYTMNMLKTVGFKYIKHKNLSLFNINSLVLGEKM